MSAPFVLLDPDEEAQVEIDELRALGVNIDSPRDNAQAQIDAWASTNLRRMARCDQELERYREAMSLEIQAIQARYARFMEPLTIRRNELEAQTKVLAVMSDFGPHKKSRSVGFGVYGRRIKKGGVVLTDEKEVIRWATSNHTMAAQEIVSAAVTMTYPIARELRLLGSAKLAVSKTRLNEYCAKNGAGIPGTALEPDSEECYARPEALT